ncbi:MAG: NAD-dependent epimerase/dehydratase family protein [Betaproteobacteria bacterium]|nr:NAD-dependent epimerase/dehydratase family protein [Betaproteobacteria bacterium]MDH5222516.1 NAD-dependent epimerase/dehydratase family protein [Betaproteobacteria bacterium]MDH5350047.1 NAD-dependent epimerase/dehydratase family protein [Betaproteobacteria bacterium]
MKVLVTGGTGFVGQHSVRALLAAGHEVRLLARDAARVPFKDVEVGLGDVTDAAAVGKAVAGCDAVLHAASVYSMRSSRYAEMRRVNTAGTRIVLEAGLAAGCNPVVHVSSVVALLGGTPRGGVLGADSPVGDPLGVYSKTKRDSELVARQLQAQGRPVAITYPGSVWGPGDPYLGESSTMAVQMAKGLLPLTTTGRMQVVDVRDVAEVHARLMKPLHGPKRYPAFGRAIRHCDLQRMVCRAAGVSRLNLPAPPWVAAANVPFLWLVARLGIHWSSSPDGAYYTSRDHAVDNSVTERELGVTFRLVEDAVRDTVDWLKSAGHLRL